MATKSRTYLSTDWQVWTYTPVSGKFRLDFSTLGGSDVLGGATDLGSVQVLDLDINSIEIQDGQRPDNNVFGSFQPGTMNLSAQLKTWSDSFIKELYNGKQIFLTLKNEATNSHPVFGKNTIFFIGQIDSLGIDVDPINQVTNLTISATDVSSTVMNLPLTFAKTNIGKDLDIEQAFVTAKAAGYINPYLYLSLDGLLSTYENTGTIVSSFGEILADFVSSDVAIPMPYYFQQYSGSYELGRNLYAKTISATGTSGELIPDSKMTKMVIGQDGNNVPTSFDLSNSTSVYSYGLTSASILSNPTIYTAVLDVPTAFLPTVANKILTYTQKVQPVEVTVNSARTFQTIVFDNNEGDYIWPQYFWQNGQEVKTTPTFTGGTYYHTIVGTSHSIDVDGWLTTYQLLKGI